VGRSAEASSPPTADPSTDLSTALSNEFLRKDSFGRNGSEHALCLGQALTPAGKTHDTALIHCQNQFLADLQPEPLPQTGWKDQPPSVSQIKDVVMACHSCIDVGHTSVVPLAIRHASTGAMRHEDLPNPLAFALIDISTATSRFFYITIMISVIRMFKAHQLNQPDGHRDHQFP
jgi:hypothetical protein